MDAFDLPYAEGAAVGYKWVDKNDLQPLFPFGHGFSYTTFHYTSIAAEPAPTGGVRVSFGIHNGGNRAGMAGGRCRVSWENASNIPQ